MKKFMQKIIHFISFALLLSNTQCGQQELELGTRIENLGQNASELNQKILTLTDSELNDPAINKLVVTLATIEGMVTPSTLMNLNFENLSIEDSIMLMLLLIAEDAENDLRDLLNEMNQETRKKQKLREETQRLKEELSEIKNNIRDEYNERVALEIPVTFDSYKKWTVFIFQNGEAKLGEKNTDFSLRALPGNMTVTLNCPNYPGQSTVLVKNHTLNEEHIVNGLTVIQEDSILEFVPQLNLSAQIQNSLVYCELEVYFKGVQKPRPWIVTSVEVNAISTLRQQQINDFHVLKRLFDIALSEGEINSDDYNSHLEIVLKSMNSFGNLDWIEVDQAVESMQAEKDQLSELGEAQQLRMQMYMDRMTKADSARSDAMKKFSETANSIIGNIK